MNVKEWIEKNGPLTSTQRMVRSAVRNFLLTADVDRLLDEAEIRSEEDPFRACCVRELIDELMFAE
jgi:hypothetical protein